MQRSSFGSLTMACQHFAIFSGHSLACGAWSPHCVPLLLGFAQAATVMSMVDFKGPSPSSHFSLTPVCSCSTTMLVWLAGARLRAGRIAGPHVCADAAWMASVHHASLSSSLGCPSAEPVVTVALARSPAGCSSLRRHTSLLDDVQSRWFSCSMGWPCCRSTLC